MKRSKSRLEAAIQFSKSKSDKALACYNLGVFHDNNAREIKAIPNYKKALTLGLSAITKSRCLAWLASSFYKIGKPREALRTLHQSQKSTNDKQLLKFLNGLEQRILKNPRKYQKRSFSS